MNSPLTLASILLLSASAAAAAPAQSISTPTARRAALKTVEALLAGSPEAVAGKSVLKDPFNPPAQDLLEDFDPNAAPKDTKANRRSDDDLMQEIANQIQPTGSVTLGGEPYLLFGEKRRKKGDKVMVSIDAVEFEVEIGTIERNRFQIRYRDLEKTRSIR